MVKCPQCNYENEENSMFCQSCGAKLEFKKSIVNDVQTIDKSSSMFEEKKKKFKIILVYLPLLVQLFVLFGASSSVKVINADRFMLYPLICFAITFYAASKLIDDEKTFNHAIISVVFSALLAILCTFGLS